LDQYLKDKGHIKSNIPNMANVISGKLLYLKMVVGASNMYKKLNDRFVLLNQNLLYENNNEKIFSLRLIEKKKIFEETILNLYVNGFENALKHFNKTNNENYNENDIEDILIRLRKSITNGKKLNDMIDLSVLFAEVGIKVEGHTFYKDYLNIVYNCISKTIINKNSEDKKNTIEGMKHEELMDCIIFSLTRNKVDVILDLWDKFGLDDLISFDTDKNFVDLFVENLQDLRQTLKKI